MNHLASIVTPPTSSIQDRLVRLSTALALTGVSRSNAYRLMAAGHFPQPVKLGRTNLFSERELQDWVVRQLNARQEG